jgi:hypothetical protein
MVVCADGVGILRIETPRMRITVEGGSGRKLLSGK